MNREAEKHSEQCQSPESSSASLLASCADLEPSFMVRNLNGGATALLVVDDPFATDDAEDEALLLVGTSAGAIYLYDIVAHLSMGLVYRAASKTTSSVSGKRMEVDFLRDDIDMQVYKQAGVVEMGALSTTSLWIQFRGGMVGIFSWDLDCHREDAQAGSRHVYRLYMLKRICFNHGGFCRGFYDAPHERLVMPDVKPGGFTGFCQIDDHENKTLYDLDTDALRADCPRAFDVDKLKPFSGAIFHVRSYHWHDRAHFFVTFEDASTMLYDVRRATVVEWHKRDAADEDDEEASEGGNNAALVVADRSARDADGTQTWIAAIVEPTLVYVLAYEPAERTFNVAGVVKRTKLDERCTAAAWSPDCYQDTPARLDHAARLALGFERGEIEVYAVRLDSEAEILHATLLYATCWERETISQLTWNGRREMLFAGTQEGRVVFYENIEPCKRRRKNKRVL